jgi:CBS domain-containing protein
MSLCKLGTSTLVTATSKMSVADASRLMREARVGCVVVLEGRRPVGILTDRDLVTRVMAEARDPSAVTVGQVMTRDPVTVRDDLDPADAAWRMRERKIRRLPVVDDDGAVMGIVTLDDLIGRLGATKAEVAEILASFHVPYQAV